MQATIFLARHALNISCIKIPDSSRKQATVTITGLQRDVPKRDWYRLLPRDKKVEELSEGYGSIRLKFKVCILLHLRLNCDNNVIPVAGQGTGLAIPQLRAARAISPGN